MYRCRAIPRSGLTAGEISDVDFLVDRCEPQHRHDFRIQRSDESKRVAEHDLIRRLADFHFMNHAIRCRIENGNEALFRVEHEAIAPAWSKPDRPRAWSGLHTGDHLTALLVNHSDASIHLAGYVNRFAQCRQRY